MESLSSQVNQGCLCHLYSYLYQTAYVHQCKGRTGSLLAGTFTQFYFGISHPRFLLVQLTEARRAAKKAQKLLEPVSNRKKNRQLEDDGLVITKALYGNRKKVKESSESNELNDDVASQVLDVTIPLNFLVSEAGQLKVCANHI